MAWVRILVGILQLLGGLLMGLSFMLAVTGVMDQESYTDRLTVVGLFTFGATLSAVGFVIAFNVEDRRK